jgi:hypothetical protein
MWVNLEGKKCDQVEVGTIQIAQLINAPILELEEIEGLGNLQIAKHSETSILRDSGPEKEFGKAGQ